MANEMNAAQLAALETAKKFGKVYAGRSAKFGGTNPDGTKPKMNTIWALVDRGLLVWANEPGIGTLAKLPEAK